MLTLKSSTLVTECWHDGRILSIEHHVVLMDESGQTITITIPADNDPGIGKVIGTTDRPYGLNFVTDGHYF